MRSIKASKFWSGVILMCLALIVGIILDIVFGVPKLVWGAAFSTLFILGFCLFGSWVIKHH